MDQLHDIRNAVDAVLGIMAAREYAVSTIKTHRGILNSLIKYMEKNNYTKLEESVGLSFVKERTGEEMDGFWGKGNQKINTQLKPVKNLFYYLNNGDLSFFMRSKIEPFAEECRFVIDTLAEVYRFDEEAKKQRMTPDQRLTYHQENSAELMEELKVWLEQHIEKVLQETMINNAITGA